MQTGSVTQLTHTVELDGHDVTFVNVRLLAAALWALTALACYRAYTMSARLAVDTIFGAPDVEEETARA